MEPTSYNITIYRGRDFIKDFIFYTEEESLEDITNWDFKSEIREDNCPESELLATFTIIKDPVNARIQLQLTDSETVLIPEGKAFWDLLVTIGNIDDSYICGKVKVKCCPTEV